MTARAGHADGGSSANGSAAAPWSAEEATGVAQTQATRIRTIKLVIKGRGGLTLWAPAANVDRVVQPQLLLGDLDRVVMVPNLYELASEIASHRQPALTRHPGWPWLLGLEPEQLQPRPEDVYDLNGADALLIGGPDPERIATLRSLVRVVAAVADYCADTQLIELLSRRPGFGDLEDTKPDSFVQAGTSISNQLWFDLAQTFSLSWEWVCDRVGGHLTWSEDTAAGSALVNASSELSDLDSSSGSGRPSMSDDVAAPTAEAAAPGCAFGHPVIAGAVFCSTCGVPIGTGPAASPTYSSPYQYEPVVAAEPPVEDRSWIAGPALHGDNRISVPIGAPVGPHNGPTDARPVADRPGGTRRPRAVWLAVAAAVVVMLGLGSLFIVKSLSPSTATLTGTVALTDDATASAGCVGQGLDTELGNGTAVDLTDPQDKKIGSTTLSNGVAANGVCTYTFSFLKTKATLASYSMHVPSQPTKMMTQSELRSNGWHVALHYGPPTTTVTGSLDLTDSDTAVEGCEGQGGYSDITPGATVIITDQDNKILGSGSLDEGTASGDVCTYSFTIDNVRQDETQYAVEITHRGKVVSSYAQMQTNNWVMDLSLGG